FQLRRFIRCSAVGAGAPERREGPLREFLAAKHGAERRLERLDMPWTILRFGRLTDAAGTGRIATALPPKAPVTLSRDDAALTVVEALARAHLARRVVHVIAGDRHVADALDAVEPRELPAVHAAGLGAAQTDNPPLDPESGGAARPARGRADEGDRDPPGPARRRAGRPRRRRDAARAHAAAARRRAPARRAPARAARPGARAARDAAARPLHELDARL